MAQVAPYRPAGVLGCGDSLLLYTLHSSGTQELTLSLFYRHIAPLERKIEYFSFDKKPMDFQYLSTWVNIGCQQALRQNLTIELCC